MSVRLILLTGSTVLWIGFVLRQSLSNRGKDAHQAFQASILAAQ